MRNVPKWLIVHHTGGTQANPLADTSHHTFEVVNNWHRQLWNFRSTLGRYIGYHYFIDKSGKITHGRADGDEGAHCIGYNRSSIGICLAGNFDATLPTKEQEHALSELLHTLMATHNIGKDKIVPHRRFSNKTCYGRKLDDDWARRLVEANPDPQEPPACHLGLWTSTELINEVIDRFRRS